MTSLPETHLGHLSENCAVCGIDLSPIEHPLVETAGDTVLLFCAEACRLRYLEDPQAYLLQREEELE